MAGLEAAEFKSATGLDSTSFTTKTQNEARDMSMLCRSDTELEVLDAKLQVLLQERILAIRELPNPCAARRRSVSKYTSGLKGATSGPHRKQSLPGPTGGCVSSTGRQGYTSAPSTPRETFPPRHWWLANGARASETDDGTSYGLAEWQPRGRCRRRIPGAGCLALQSSRSRAKTWRRWLFACDGPSPTTCNAAQHQVVALTFFFGYAV